jgi:hypothetical protein
MAETLQGHLMLVRGEVDNNANLVETMRFVDAPNQSQLGFGNSPHTEPVSWRGTESLSNPAVQGLFRRTSSGSDAAEEF